MVGEYKKNPNVEYTEPNFIAYALWAPNDPLYSYQWHLDNAVYGGIGMEEAWELLGYRCIRVHRIAVDVYVWQTKGMPKFVPECGLIVGTTDKIEGIP